MGMDSSKIKEIINQAKGVSQGDNPESLMKDMVNDMSKSPTFAVAIISHLKNTGVDLFSHSGEVADQFKQKFKPQIEKLGKTEFAQISKIAKRLFG